MLGAPWAWAYPMRSIAGPLGYMVVRAERELGVDGQFLAQVMAQQTGVAVSNAQLHARERATALELARTNEALQDTVATLRRGMQIHKRLTRVAAAGEGSAVHRRCTAWPDRVAGGGRGEVRQLVRLGGPRQAQPLPRPVTGSSCCAA